VRILYHHRTQAEDGQAVHIRALIEAFRALGHEVREVALVRRAAGPRDERLAGAHAARRSPWSLVARAPRFARELFEYAYGSVAQRRILREAVRFDPHFVYERYAFGNTGGVAATRRLRRPLVLEVNAPMVLELERTRGLVFPGLARKVERHVLTSAARVCAVSGVLARMLEERGVARERLLVTPNGVDLARYAWAEHPETRAAVRLAARAELGLAPDELALGFVGYVRDWHRLDLALEALATRELAHASLVLIGVGPAMSDLEPRARSLGVGARLRLHGARPHAEIPTLLPAFDVALLPAINPYASPLKLFEYMAAGLAIVAPRQANLEEVLVDGENALLAPVVAAGIHAARARLALAEALRARHGQRARATIAERDLTWQGNARRVMRAVEGLA
jgi:glycosyltransferase involved in cell wall biosynthesis